MGTKVNSILKRWLARFVRSDIYVKVERTISLVLQVRTVTKEIIPCTVVGVKHAKRDTGVRVHIKKKVVLLERMEM